MEKTYLGDAVYASFDGFHIVLTTEDGIRATNTIFLEPEVLKALIKYKQKIEEEIACENLKNENKG